MKDILLRYFRYKEKSCPWIDMSIIKTERQNLNMDEKIEELLGFYSKPDEGEDIPLLLKALEDKITIETNLVKTCNTCLTFRLAKDFPDGPFGIGYGNYLTALPRNQRDRLMNDQEYAKKELELHKRLYPLFVEFARDNKFRKLE